MTSGFFLQALSPADMSFLSISPEVQCSISVSFNCGSALSNSEILVVPCQRDPLCVSYLGP